MFKRLLDNWVYGGFLAGLLLLAITPVLAGSWPVWLLAVWIQLPVYMLHQYEEHDGDRFRLFVNRTVAGGVEALDPLAVFLINIPGVWGVIVLSWYMAAAIRPGLGLIAVYLVLVNAGGHIAALAALRRYNPGAITAIVCFLPAGAWGLFSMQKAGASLADHAIGAGVAIGIHAAIVLYVRLRVARFAKSADTPLLR